MGLGRKSYEIVADELRKMIASGELCPGDKLDTIEALARNYGVGRSTVREALSLLKARGLIESIQGGGTYVSSNHTQDFAEIQRTLLTGGVELVQVLQVRQIIEVGCIGLATQYRTESNLEELDGIVHRMQHSVGDEDVSQVYDVQFHLAIAKATQNPLLLHMMENISSIMSRTIQHSRKLWLYSEQESARRLYEEHRKMFEAILTQDERLAVETMTRHLEKVASAFQLGEEERF